MSDPSYFLARSGETYGPFTLGEIEKFRETGEYRKFSWLWDPSPAAPGWKPVDPPPPPPRVRTDGRAGNGRARPSAPPIQGVSALCFDAGRLQAGILVGATESGCDFISSSPTDGPLFSPRRVVRLHLADEKGRSMEVTARVGSVRLDAGRWHYRIQWKRCPGILKKIEPLENSETASNPVE